MTIEIVTAEEKHIEAIGQLWWEFMLFHQDIDPIFTPRDNAVPGFEENQVRRLMKSDEGHVLVAIDKGNIVGFSLSEIKGASPAFKREKYGYIDTVAVTASYRRQGVGKKIYDEIVRWFQVNNIIRVELGTTAQNLVANSFWQKQGFRIYMHNLYKEIK